MGREIRTAPTSAVFALHPQGVRGTCCWCGGAVTEKTPMRGWLKYWHDSCQAEYQICSQPEMARRFVRDRDNGICGDCGAEADTVQRTHVHNKNGIGHPFEWTFETEAWHVDHKIPLWKVAHLPPIERIEYFKLHNLLTRCEPCHALKTKEEAAERAHLRRLSEPQPEKPKRKWPSRPFKRQDSNCKDINT